MVTLANLRALSADALAQHVHFLLLPDTLPSAESLQVLANKCQQVAVHLQQQIKQTSTLAPAIVGVAEQSALPDNEASHNDRPVPIIQEQNAVGVQPPGRNKRRLGEISRLRGDSTQQKEHEMDSVLLRCSEALYD